MSNPHDKALLDFESEDTSVRELPRADAGVAVAPPIAGRGLSELIAAARPRAFAPAVHGELPRTVTPPDTSRPARPPVTRSVALPRASRRRHAHLRDIIRQTFDHQLAQWLITIRELNARLASVRVTLPRIPREVAAAFAAGLITGALLFWLLMPSAGGNDAANDGAIVVQPAALAGDIRLPRPAATPPPVATSGSATKQDSAAAARPATAAAAGETEISSRAPSQAGFRGSLTVRSRPSGATVFLNGRAVGRTPIVLANQPAGSRALRVTLDGYDIWTSAVRVVANQENIVTADLQRRGTDSSNGTF